MNKNSKKSVTPCFKRWSRKNWSVFASLHKVVKIGVLSLGMSILTLPYNVALAQKQANDTVRKEMLDEIKVVTQRSNPTRGMISPVQAYSRVKMVNLPLQTVETALKVNPAVDLRERGAKGVQADISLFGGSTDQTMIMLNGVNFTDAQTGHQSHALPIDLEGVSGINLIGGVPGIGAFTGAVNVTTAPLYPNYIRGELSGGQHGYLYGSLSGAVQKGDLSAMVISSLRKSDGYIQNTDFKKVNFYTRITYDSQKAGVFDFQAGYQNKFFGANSFYSLKYPNQAEQTETYLASLRWRKHFLKNLSVGSIISYRKNYDRFELFRGSDNAPAWYSGHNYHNTDNVGVNINLDYKWIAGTSSIGADYTFNHIYSNVLGDELPEKLPIKGELDKYYLKAKGRNIINGWLRHNAKVGKFDFVGSANYAYSPYGSSFMWSLGAGYHPINSVGINISAAESMRLPTFTDLYYTTSTHTGNIKLAPENAITYRATFDFNGAALKGNSGLAGFNAYASVFYRNGKNIIDWVKKDEESKWESMQITKLNTFGTEVSVSYSLKKVLKDISVSYGYIYSDKKSGDYISQYALDYLKNKVSLSANIEIVKDLTLNVMGTWFDRNGNYLNAKSELVPYNSYWSLDARLNWDFSKFGVFVDATNILNAKYFDYGGLLQPGTWVIGGIRITKGG